MSEKKRIYHIDCTEADIEVFKYTDVNELTHDAYETRVTNKLTKENDWVTTNTPQGAIALADEIRNGL
jgi:hypothetical protein